MHYGESMRTKSTSRTQHLAKPEAILVIDDDAMQSISLPTAHMA